MIKHLKKWWSRWRSSDSGEFITADEAAKLDPATTEETKVRRKGKRK